MDQAGRLHAFDNLRAIMMWLGIFLHVAINHTTGASPLPWRDSPTSSLADLILLFIHAFRMPLFFILAGFFIALLVARRGHEGTPAHRMHRLALPFAIFWPILIVCTMVCHAGMLASSGSFIPQLPEVLHNGLFFATGLLAYRHQDALFPYFTRNCWKYAVAGLVTFGLALRHLPRQNRVLRYVSDSSYWVFLVHMLGTIGFGILVYSLPLGAGAKMLTNIAATTVVCLISYQLLVRHAIIGVLLNGRRQSAPQATALPVTAGQS